MDVVKQIIRFCIEVTSPPGNKRVVTSYSTTDGSSISFQTSLKFSYFA